MSDSSSPRSVMLLVLGIATATLVVVAGWMRRPPGEEGASPEPSVAAPPTDGSAGGPGAARVPHACSADELARVAGVDVGATLATDWRTDAITCVDGEPCTRIEVSHAAEHLSLRVCPHVEGAPLAPVTHGTLDVFYDMPATPEEAVADPTIQAVLGAVVARMTAS